MTVPCRQKGILDRGKKSGKLMQSYQSPFTLHAEHGECKPKYEKELGGNIKVESVLKMHRPTTARRKQTRTINVVHVHVLSLHDMICFGY